MSVASYAAPQRFPFPSFGLPVRLPDRLRLPAQLHGAPDPPVAVSDDARDLAATRDGDSTAFEALVRRHQTPLYNFSLRMLGRPEDAADVVQECFIQLYSHVGTLDARDPLAPWLFRVARNRCIDLIRRRRTVSLTVPDDTDAPAAVELVDAEPLPEELAERADLQRVLAEAIAQLPPTYGEVVALRYAGERSFAEIAAILDCDEGAARVRFHRAKTLLRNQLRSLAPEA